MGYGLGWGKDATIQRPQIIIVMVVLGLRFVRDGEIALLILQKILALDLLPFIPLTALIH